MSARPGLRAKEKGQTAKGQGEPLGADRDVLYASQV